MEYIYEMTGYKDGKSIRFERAESEKDMNIVLAFWKKEGMLDQIDVCAVTPDTNLAHNKTIYKRNGNKWGKPHECYVGEDESCPS